MNKAFSLVIHFFLLLCISGLGESSLEIDHIAGHLDFYSKVNKTNHDNIDDNTDRHVHCHKHSEDGEEHEHKHEHSKLSQIEIKILANSFDLRFKLISSFKPANRLFVNSHNSNPHLLKIFRPPIS